MSRRYSKNRKKQGGARRALLVFLLTVLILAALAFGVRGIPSITMRLSIRR